MKLSTVDGKQVLKLSKKEWNQIGKTAGWNTKDYVVDLAKAIKTLQKAFEDAPELLAYIDNRVIDEMRLAIQKTLAKLDKKPGSILGSIEGIEDKVLSRNWAKPPQEMLPS